VPELDVLRTDSGRGAAAMSVQKENKKCIYCGGKQDEYPLAVCKSCLDLWNKNYEKFMPIDDDYHKLVANCEAYIRQAMTGHTCGQECGGDPYFYGSSDCFGCFPDTLGHYRNAAEMVIAWTKGWIEKNIMKNVLLKQNTKAEKT